MSVNDNTGGAVFSRVADLAALVFSGADAASFMQGQFSSDVSALPEGGGWQRSAYCSPKGRMLASFILCRRRGGDWAALLSADIADDTAKRLRMFVLRAKAAIARAPAAFAFASGESENGLGFFSDEDDILTIGEGGGRKLLCCLRGDAGRLIPAGAALADDLSWRRAQIADAVPWVRAGTREMFIPQTVNYEAPPLDGVSFQKGCYVGQEVVARLRYRGRVKRRARPATGTGAPPEPGAVLRDAAGTAMGNVVDAVAAADDGKFCALVCAQLSAAEPLLEDGRELRLLPPPHPIPEGEAD